MTRITNIVPIRHAETEKSVDRLESKRWAVRERPASLVVTDARTRFEADDLCELLRTDLAPILGDLGVDFSVSPPAKSLEYGENYIFRIEGTDKLAERIRDYIPQQKGFSVTVDPFKYYEYIRLPLARRLNPPCALTKKSFLELLEESYRAHHTFDVFLNSLLWEWGDGHKRMSPPAFCNWMKKCNAKGAWAKEPTVHNHTVYAWLDPETTSRLPGNVVAKLIGAFIPDIPLPPDLGSIAYGLQLREFFPHG